MKKPLLLILLAAQPLLVSKAEAEIQAHTVIRHYDDSRTQVTTPALDVSATFNKDQMKVSAGWTQDILTSSSADVATFSSKGVIDDKRTEYSTSFETLIPDGTMSVGYIQSDEDDYHSKTISAGATREFYQKNTVVSFGFANGDDQITSMKDATFDKKMHNQTYSLSLTQVLSKISLVQLIFDYRVENGFLASPYRQAKIINTALNQGEATGEVHPLTRNRNALAIKYNHFITPWKTTSATTYRLYQDSWGVLSHTLEERFSREFNKYWSGSVNVRYYTQREANFYKDYYIDDPGPFHTGNNTLAAYDSYLLAVRPSYAITEKMLVFGKIEYFMQKFKNATDAGPSISLLSDDKELGITALVLGLGLDVKF